MGRGRFVGEAGKDVGERGDAAEQGHSAGVPEAEARRTLALVDARQHDRLQGGGVGQAGLAFAEGREEPGVHIGPETAQRSPVVGVEGLFEPEVGRVVHRRLHPEGPAFFKYALALEHL